MKTIRLNKNFFNQDLLYIFLSLIFWLIAEYLTVWSSKLNEWLAIFPLAILQYFFIILIFYFLLFRFSWNEKRVLISMIFVMYVFELLWQNALLLNPLCFIPISIILVSIWGFLTFIPYWLVTRNLSRHKLTALFYCLWPLFFFVSSILMQLI